MSDPAFRKKIEPLEKYLKRKDLVEIIINREGEISLETITGEWVHKTDKSITRDNIRQLTTLMANLSGQEFDHINPIFSGRLPEYGHRVQVNMGAHVSSGMAVAIRIGKATVYPIESYMPKEQADYLIDMVKQGKTILVSAPTGAGKTTFLNSLVSHIPDHQRIVTIEDAQELIIPHRNHTGFLKSKNSTDVAGLSFSDFINSTLRLRPDRILLGEIDIENTMAFLNIANSGHSGSISTIHAESKEEVLNKLCLNAQLAGAKGGKSEIMSYAKEAIDIIVSLNKRLENGKRVFEATITNM